MNVQYSEIAGMIDHALLSPALTVGELEDGCQLAMAYQVASVCILPYYLRRGSDLLADSGVVPSTVIGFPLGGHTTAIKVAEASQAIDDGGIELDMVVNISQVVSGEWKYVEREIAAVMRVAHSAGRKVKVIFENAYLDDTQKRTLCRICSDLNADWVKTSTGFAGSGSTKADLELMRAHAALHVQVKAAGGIRDLATVLEARSVGATRCGASRTRDILDECRRTLSLAPIAFVGKSSASGY